MCIILKVFFAFVTILLLFYILDFIALRPLESLLPHHG